MSNIEEKFYANIRNGVEYNIPDDLILTKKEILMLEFINSLIEYAIYKHDDEIKEHIFQNSVQ